jgi:hypothetical protein
MGTESLQSSQLVASIDEEWLQRDANLLRAKRAFASEAQISIAFLLCWKTSMYEIVISVPLKISVVACNTICWSSSLQCSIAFGMQECFSSAIFLNN